MKITVAHIDHQCRAILIISDAIGEKTVGGIFNIVNFVICRCDKNFTFDFLIQLIGLFAQTLDFGGVKDQRYQ